MTWQILLISCVNIVALVGIAIKIGMFHGKMSALLEGLSTQVSELKGRDSGHEVNVQGIDRRTTVLEAQVAAFRERFGSNPHYDVPRGKRT